jgi:hypothetical protein
MVLFGEMFLNFAVCRPDSECDVSSDIDEASRWHVVVLLRITLPDVDCMDSQIIFMMSLWFEKIYSFFHFASHILGAGLAQAV